MKYRWVIAPSDESQVCALSDGLKLSKVFAQCLLNRGFGSLESASNFISPKLKQLEDPFLLPNMEAAVVRLLQARANQESLVIFGDYDVDGVTSSALLKQFLTDLGWTVETYLPHRLEEGYGLSQEAVENCVAKFPIQLLLAVDCGSTSISSIAWLRDRNIDVVVLDHHQVSEPAPAAVALVNPQLSKSREPNTLGASGKGQFTELCSAGLAFKLAHALLKRLREMGDPSAQTYDLRPLLDLVALGTIADIVPLIGENRILVTSGLQRLNETDRPGILALKDVAQITNAIGEYEVGFQLGPRLNAAGRLENAESSLALLLSRSIQEARPTAQLLDSHNRSRQNIEKEIAEEVIETVRSRFNAERDFCIVEGNSNWHIGVVGIVASRVLHEFYRPTIILGGDGEQWRGSGRSVEGFDLAAGLRGCNELLVRHGGHAMAAGVSMKPEMLTALRERLNELVRCALKPEQLQPTLRIDAEVELKDITIERIEELELLKPSGPGNPSVNLIVRGVSHQRSPQRMGKENKHVNFWVTDGARTIEAVWWNCGDAPLPKVMFDLAFSPRINEFNGRRTVQLKVLDWRPPT